MTPAFCEVTEILKPTGTKKFVTKLNGWKLERVAPDRVFEKQSHVRLNL